MGFWKVSAYWQSSPMPSSSPSPLTTSPASSMPSNMALVWTRVTVMRSMWISVCSRILQAQCLTVCLTLCLRFNSPLFLLRCLRGYMNSSLSVFDMGEPKNGSYVQSRYCRCLFLLCHLYFTFSLSYLFLCYLLVTVHLPSVLLILANC